MGLLETMLNLFKSKGVDLTPEEVAKLADENNKSNSAVKSVKQVEPKEAIQENKGNTQATKTNTETVDLIDKITQKYERIIEEKDTQITELNNKFDGFLQSYQKEKEEEANAREAFKKEQEEKAKKELETKVNEYIDTNVIKAGKIAPKDEKTIADMKAMGIDNFERLETWVNSIPSQPQNNEKNYTSNENNGSQETFSSNKELNDYLSTFTINDSTVGKSIN